MKSITPLIALIAIIALYAPLTLGAGSTTKAGAAIEPGAKTGVAPNLVKNGDAETGDFTNWLRLKELTSEDVHSGKKCFKAVGSTIVVSKAFIPIDANKTYQLSGWFKSTGEDPSNIYFGFVPFDAQKRQIAPVFVNITKGTETTLAEACAKDDKVLKITNASKWKTGPFHAIAFTTDDSGAYKDLPNRNVTGYGVDKVEQKDGFWEVTLAKPCGKAYGAGTKIREHRSGGTYIYTGGHGKVPGEWTEYKGTITGESPTGVPSDTFWNSTRFVRIIILANLNQKKKDATLLLDDIKLVEAATPKVKAE